MRNNSQSQPVNQVQQHGEMKMINITRYQAIRFLARHQIDTPDNLRNWTSEELQQSINFVNNELRYDNGE